MGAVWRENSKRSTPNTSLEMFQDIVSAGADIPSSWKREKFTSEASSQTSEVLTNDVHIQTTGLATVAVQTDEEPRQPYKLVVDNSLELKEFLKRVEPLISEQLKRNVQSHAFDGYSVQWEEESTVVTCTHTLFEATTNSEFHCTGLSWNSTGSVLAVAYGRLDHQDWCAHKSYLCTWNLDRRSLDSNKADITIDVPSCLTCVSCHPELPAVIAGGTFSGEVRVWNTGLTGDPLLAYSGLSDLGHKEPVAQVTWVLDQEDRRHRYLLLSLGNDGKVLVWEVVSGQKELKAVKALRLLTESVPRSIRISRAKGDAEIGGTCLSFSCEDKNLFVVGSENGGIYKCSLQTLVPPGIDFHTTAEADLQSPIKFSFRPHYGPVYDISCSPFHRNLFLSCATDTTTRLYSLLDPNPILSLEPGCGYLFSVCWSLSRPLVFAIGTGLGQVLLYDLKFSQIKPRVTLDASPHKRAIYSLSYNQKRPQVLATGDASGVVRVWRLSTELTAQGSNEVEQLNSLALQTVSSATL